MSVLPLLAINALLMMAAAGGLALASDLSLLALTHLALGLGLLPLILAAMAYFVPVLTRSNARLPKSLNLAPLGAWLGAAALIAGFTGRLPDALATHLAFTLAFSALAVLSVWAWQRRRRTVGRPHPGLNWYLAALACLTLALIAVPLMKVWPEQHLALRRLHLHLNLLGFIGLTAIGTLQVLLPTTLSRPDPQAAQRLGQDLKYALLGTLLLALGAAWFKPLALAGLAFYLVAPLRMVWHWQQHFRPQLIALHGATPSLLLASLGFIGLLLLGPGHAWAGLGGPASIAAFVLAFLMPLVSGTATQLLPVWLRPGPQREWHTRFRTALGQFSGPRALLMVLGGWSLALGQPMGLWLGAASLGLLLAVFLRAAWLARNEAS